ncbi:PTS glucitol/sorbitol transporter subunit IIB [Saccharopolyspora erythraea]|uniref:PTS glucitol/sorbitol transporter subunit IIB n=1 Tax=Saccharopolyspora erythraea TaxID=1836 RepID=UPI001BA6CD56|nr:PTS glucitol/sorbitol transporter subunit IIB [Saccharopolyspora erythraea]QUH04135.1 PTS glucitol/sorbitol transporter subunit IIB [Saccharopolyspora erythraea]
MTTQENRKHAAVSVRPGSAGWGTGWVLRPTETRNKVLSVTGGGIHPVAARIAELTGAEPVDAFTENVPDDEVLCAVINCGGTARIGIYPRKKIPTVDVYPGGPSGPLAQFITEDVFVSAVGLNEIVPCDADGDSTPEEPVPDRSAEQAKATPPSPASPMDSADKGSRRGWLNAGTGVFVSFSTGVGAAINTLIAAGRQTITLVLQTILPFMAYVSLLLGFVHYTGVAHAVGQVLAPVATNPVGLVAIGAVTALPFLSPVLGPGAAIAQVIGTLMGSQIAIGAIPVQYALPTLFAINGQAGCDFVPVGLALGEAKSETVAVGTPAVLISRMITAPAAVIIAWAASFGL